MSTTEKVRLVETVEEQYGLELALSAVQLPKSTWYYHQNQKQDYQEKFEHLHPELEEIACEHPEYGIPRITKELQDVYQIVINHKVVQRLLRLWRLSLVCFNVEKSTTLISENLPPRRITKSFLHEKTNHFKIEKPTPITS